MIVSLAMKSRKGWSWRHFSFLDLFPNMIDGEADRRGYCNNCEWAYYAHPLLPDGAKLCTRIFKKNYMPKLRIKDLV